MAGQKEDKQDFRANLKVVKKDNVIDDIVNKVPFFYFYKRTIPDHNVYLHALPWLYMFNLITSANGQEDWQAWMVQKRQR